MKLKLESLEFDQTFGIKVPNSCSLQQLIDTLSHTIASSSSSSSMHLSQPCLMGLPMELKGLILERVPGVDLGKLTCTCSELRFLCSDNELWKNKFLEEFREETRDFDFKDWKHCFQLKCFQLKLRRFQIKLGRFQLKLGRFQINLCSFQLKLMF